MTDQNSFKQSILQASPGPSDPFAVAYLQLCQVSYCDPSQIAAKVAQLPSIVVGGGVWKCIWGPAYNSDDANLVFVASYSTGPNLPPVFAAVVTRGTDADVHDGWGVIEQIWEDLDVTNQVELPWLINSPVRVAGGTIDGLTEIQDLTYNNVTLLQFLSSYLGAPANNNPVLIVTGHSLGGCLTTVVAPWLQSQLSAATSVLHVIPATFAAPTAGNAAFASYFQSTFGYSMRVFNTLDAVPFAWQNIDGLIDLYQGCGLEIPDLVYAGITGYDYLMWFAGVSYVQPATNQMALTGSCLSTSDWYSEALYQHHTTTYMTLLNGTSVACPTSVEPTPRPRSQSRLRKRFGPVSSLPIRTARS